MGDTSISHPGMYPSIVYYNGQLLVGFKLQYAPYGEDLFYRIVLMRGILGAVKKSIGILAI
jgi:hypothetical protein